MQVKTLKILTIAKITLCRLNSASVRVPKSLDSTYTLGKETPHIDCFRYILMCALSYTIRKLTMTLEIIWLSTGT